MALHIHWLTVAFLNALHISWALGKYSELDMLLFSKMFSFIFQCNLHFCYNCACFMWTYVTQSKIVLFIVIMKEYEYDKPIADYVLNIYNEISTLWKCKLINVNEWQTWPPDNIILYLLKFSQALCFRLLYNKFKFCIVSTCTVFVLVGYDLIHVTLPFDEVKILLGTQQVCVHVPYVSISCSLQFNIICTVCIFIMLFSKPIWDEM